MTLRPRLLTVSPALACHTCGTLTTTALFLGGDDRRGLLLPFCLKHQPTQWRVTDRDWTMLAQQPGDWQNPTEEA